MQSHRLLLAASAVICSFGLAMNSAEASISHVSVHTTPHVSAHTTPHVSVHTTPHVSAHTTPHVRATHMSPHVSRSVTHTTPHVRYSPKHLRPVKSTHTPKAAGSSVKSLTKSKKASLLTTMSQSKQLRLAQSAKRFTRKQASRVFAANRIAPAYQTAYHRQSIIRNPWFWLFMINHHRINQRTRADAQYLKGYRYGMQQGQSDLKAHSRQHQNLTEDQKRMHNSRWQEGYAHGYQDAVSPTAKQHQPVSTATN